MATLFKTTNGQYEPLAEFKQHSKLRWEQSMPEPPKVKVKRLSRLPKPKFQDVDFYAASKKRTRVRKAKEGPQAMYKQQHSTAVAVRDPNAQFPRINTSLKFEPEPPPEPRTIVFKKTKRGYKLLNSGESSSTSTSETPKRTRKPKLEPKEIKRAPGVMPSKPRGYVRRTKVMQGTKGVRNTYSIAKSRDALHTQLDLRRVAKSQLNSPKASIRIKAQKVYQEASKKAARLIKSGARHRVYQGSLSGKSASKASYGIKKGVLRFKK